MSEIVSKAYRPNPEKCCELHVFGSGECSCGTRQVLAEPPVMIEPGRCYPIEPEYRCPHCHNREVVVRLDNGAHYCSLCRRRAE